MSIAISSIYCSTDQEIVQSENFAEFYEQYKSILFRFINGRLNYRYDESQEFAADLWAEAWELLYTNKLASLTPGWLINRAKCRIKDRYRMSNRRKKITYSPIKHDRGINMQTEENIDFRTILNKLNKDQAMVGWLFFRDGMTTSEIAEFLKLSVSSVERKIASVIASAEAVLAGQETPTVQSNKKTKAMVLETITGCYLSPAQIAEKIGIARNTICKMLLRMDETEVTRLNGRYTAVANSTVTV